jgi:hypothetical protein
MGGQGMTLALRAMERMMRKAMDDDAPAMILRLFSACAHNIRGAVNPN